MTNSQTTAQIYFTNGTSQIYTLDATDGTEGELLELISGSGIGTAAQGLSVDGLSVSCENQVEYLSIEDNLGTVIFSTGGCAGESQQAVAYSIPPRTIGLNFSINVLTAAT